MVSALVGLVLSFLLLYRRRWPGPVAVACLLGVAVGLANGPAWLALLSLAIRRRDRVLVVLTSLTIGTSVVAAQTLGLGPVLALFLASTAYSAAVAGGAYLGARRALLRTLTERAERAEAEQALRSDQARLAERARIAQEMHDVLAHKISLVTLQAGGLEVRADAGPPEVERVAGMIRVTAREASEDLRGVLGVLRGAGADGVLDGTDLVPQPTLDDIAALVGSSRSAGVQVTLDWRVPSSVQVPDTLSRTMFRVVQEGLTNVHKHARGATTRVSVVAVPGHRLEVEVINRLPVGSDLEPLLPGTGTGLAGLTERVRLAGGQLQAGPADGDFEVRATIPWPVAAPPQTPPTPTTSPRAPSATTSWPVHPDPTLQARP